MPYAVLAIGGVTLNRLAELRACGAAGAAAIRLYVIAQDEIGGVGLPCGLPLEVLVEQAESV